MTSVIIVFPFTVIITTLPSSEKICPPQYLLLSGYSDYQKFKRSAKTLKWYLKLTSLPAVDQSSTHWMQLPSVILINI